MLQVQFHKSDVLDQ
jgi:hypothetical protein